MVPLHTGVRDRFSDLRKKFLLEPHAMNMMLRLMKGFHQLTLSIAIH